MLDEPKPPIVLRNCPFCGHHPGDEAFAFVDGQGNKWGRVECGCGACGPDVRTSYKPIEHWSPAAAEAWNERAGDA